MNNLEYEYSFKVESLEPYIEYCTKNNYNDIEESHQVRTIYRNKNKTMARTTVNVKDGNIVKRLDFKEDNWQANQLVKEMKESLPIEYTDDEAIESILHFLEYFKDNRLERKRYVFECNDVKFELDDYIYPEVAKVVGIEGDKIKVDIVYNELKSLYDLK